jgi:hypothetical protein
VNNLHKWADYLVSAVRTHPNQNRIESLEVHSDFGNMVSETALLSREDVIANIKKGVTYSTVFRTAMGKWRKGEDVHLLTINGEDYLRTDTENTPQDQFDDVPEL